ncbi:MAG: hypothetical protein ACLTNU_00520 [Coprobacillus cateniformis]|uniref:hypothetical protein n=1 Tax=Coprobacillus cateniformis TaxID=100884 RepID=UPI00399478C0
MSPRQNKEKRDVHDSTTEFFLKVVQKEKEADQKKVLQKKILVLQKQKLLIQLGDSIIILIKH